VTVGYTASNSYLNPGYLICRRPAQCRLDYQTDHTGNLPFVDYYQPILDRWELAFSASWYDMGNPARWSPIHQLVSDRMLRYFHEHILGEESLPELSGAPAGREIFYLTDYDGRSLTLEPNRVYTLPLRLDLTRYVDLRRTARARLSLNASLHVAYPLDGEDALSRGVDLGVSVNFIRSLRLTPNISSTFHLQLSKFRPGIHVVNEEAPLSGEHSPRSGYALTYGLRFASMFNGRAPCSFALSEITNTARYDRDSVWAVDTVIFAGGKNLRSALTTANDFAVLSLACEHGPRQYQVAFVEDIAGFSQIFGTDGAAATYDPDFTVNASVSWRLGAHKARADSASE
jgi:hypothetical protein